MQVNQAKHVLDGQDRDSTEFATKSVSGVARAQLEASTDISTQGPNLKHVSPSLFFCFYIKQDKQHRSCAQNHGEPKAGRSGQEGGAHLGDWSLAERYAEGEVLGGREELGCSLIA